MLEFLGSMRVSKFELNLRVIAGLILKCQGVSYGFATYSSPKL